MLLYVNSGKARVCMLIIPDLYKVSRHSPFYIGNPYFVNSYNRMLSFQVNHRLLLNTNLAMRWLPSFDYEYLNTESIIDLKPEDVYSSKRWEYYGLQLEGESPAEKYQDSFSIKEMEQSTVLHRSELFKALRKYNYHLTENPVSSSVPILNMDKTNILSEQEVVQGIFTYLESWIHDMIDFFEEMTKANFLVEEINVFSFTYNQSGEIQYFCDFHKVKFARGMNQEVLLIHNLRELGKVINTTHFTNEYQTYYPYMNSEIFSENVHYQKLSAIEQKYSNHFVTFQNFRDLFQQPESKLTGQIGVFIDLAYIYVGLQSYFINFDLLLLELLGAEKKRKITDLFSVQFIPQYESKEKNERVGMWLSHIREQLERYDIHVKEVSNQTKKAKRFINGEEFDVDDQYLIQLLRQNRGKYSEVVVITGDKHFKKELEAQEEAGSIVHLVSCTKLDTNKELTERFENHYYITDFINSIYVRREFETNERK